MTVELGGGARMMITSLRAEKLLKQKDIAKSTNSKHRKI